MASLPPPSPPPFDLLPDELLLIIIERVLDYEQKGYEFKHYDIDQGENLKLVCRRFHSLVVPILLRHLSLPIIDAVEYPAPLLRHHALLHDNPHLRSFCRSVSINLSIFSHSDKAIARLEKTIDLRTVWNLVFDLIKWSKSVQHLCIGFFLRTSPCEEQDPAFSLVKHISQEMLGLRYLSLSGIWYHELYGGGKLTDVMKYVNLPCLETLKLSEMGIKIPSEASVVSDIMLQKSRSASFSNLILIDCTDIPEAIAGMILWSRNLVSFTLHVSKGIGHIKKLKEVLNYLSPHKSTLKKVWIDTLGDFELGQAVDIHSVDFPELEELQLAVAHLRADHEGDAAGRLLTNIDRLFGPTLHTFGISFGPMGVMGVTVKAFGSREEALVREIARYACSQGSALKIIDIWFKPLEPSYKDSEEYCEGRIDDPWYQMQRLEKEIEKYGVTLRWEPPPWTKKEEWLRLIKKESKDIDE